jgi:iron complex transport system ATP-binding protein
MDRFGVGRLAQARFAGLSHGEKTRVALPRPWMADIAVFILDEPCAGLDIKGREDLLQMVGQYLGRREKPVQLIYVTHHPEEILPGFTHILILKDGRVFAQGPRNDVLTDRLISTAFDAPLRIHNRANRPWIEVLSTS